MGELAGARQRQLVAHRVVGRVLRHRCHVGLMAQANALHHDVGATGLQREGAFSVFAVVDGVFQVVLVQHHVHAANILRADAVALGAQCTLGCIQLEMLFPELRNLAALFVHIDKGEQLIAHELGIGVANGQGGQYRVNDPQIAQTSHEVVLL